MWPPDLAQQYERLRAQVVANEGERVVRDRTVSAEILISQGVIGWATRWSGGDPVREDHHREAETASVSEVAAPGSRSERASHESLLQSGTV